MKGQLILVSTEQIKFSEHSITITNDVAAHGGVSLGDCCPECGSGELLEDFLMNKFRCLSCGFDPDPAPELTHGRQQP